MFESFYHQLYSFSLKYGVDEFGAEEITENTFIKLWNNRSKIEKIKHPKSYLYRMVANASIDYIKKKKKDVSFNPEVHDKVFVTEGDEVEEEVHSTLFKALDSLPPKCRKVFMLSCLEGLKYKDIAEDLDISLNTVKSQRARAIQILREKLSDFFM